MLYILRILDAHRLLIWLLHTLHTYICIIYIYNTTRVVMTYIFSKGYFSLIACSFFSELVYYQSSKCIQGDPFKSLHSFKKKPILHDEILIAVKQHFWKTSNFWQFLLSHNFIVWVITYSHPYFYKITKYKTLNFHVLCIANDIELCKIKISK